VRQALSHRYPPPVMAALAPTYSLRLGLAAGQLAGRFHVARLDFTAAETLSDVVVQRLSAGDDGPVASFALTMPEVDKAQLEQAQKEMAAFQELWNNSPAQVVQNAAEPDLAALLRHLARRMFLSPRLRPLLEEAVTNG
jgi:hypothetical protein